MKTSDFYYDLPPELIAQTPLAQRDSSRLMVLHKNSGEISHRRFSDILDYLHPGDCLVMNDSRVLPARLLGKRLPSGGAIELLLLTDRGDGVWECLAKPGKKLQAGAQVSFGEGELRAQVLQVLDNGNRLVQFHYEGIFLEVLERLGKMPLPPYIKEELADSERYQTVYSKVNGSAAAPTAGLHFTQELLREIEATGVALAYVTLHVGLGTFRPVKAEEVTEHHMHAELCMISEQTAQILNAARARGGRIVCVGTTSCRTIESLVLPDGSFAAASKWTDIFIYPGYRFRAMDALITNFHLPESTLLMLISAFAGYETVMRAYRTAVQERYRFFSFGDVMYLHGEASK
ncbi:MAG: tRNA preQ1(34) S-adenosylmethionine ribosyltransferase-isomerase QueA [Oscillospiraceae bacterium]|nr:tRNA preQ1(34) S-adenosylmethionine ribosyltransferase-isomerase QueA [Oscillospiraceae bacterium]